MHSELIERHHQVRRQLFEAHNPLHGMAVRPVWVSHDQDGAGEVYQANLHHPRHWSLEDAIAGDVEEPGVTPTTPDMEKAKMISIRTEPHGDAYPVKVAPPKANQYQVVGGLGGRLNGLTMTGILDDARYHGLGKTRAATNKRIEEQAGKLAQIQTNMMARQAEAGDGKVALQEHVLPTTREQALAYAEAVHAGDEEGAAHALRSYPGGGKSQFVVQYANGHPGEGMMVYSHTSGVARVLAQALKAEGHPAEWVDTGSHGLVTLPNVNRATVGKVHVIHHDGPVETVPDPNYHIAVHALRTEGEA